MGRLRKLDWAEASQGEEKVMIHNVYVFFQTHPFADWVAYYVLMVMIDQMPPPMPNGNAFYKWFFGVMQILAANLVRSKRGVQGTLGQPTLFTTSVPPPPNPTSPPTPPPNPTTPSTGNVKYG